MKNLFAYVFLMAGALSMLTACSSDGENEPGGNHPVAPGDGLQTKTYTDADGLSLSVDDEPVIGQTVTFTPAAGGTGTVTIAGAPFDFDGMMMDAGDNNGQAFVIPTSSVIPGSASVSFPVVLSGGEDGYSFDGTASSNYCTFTYAGSVAADTMVLNISNIALKDASMAGFYEMPDLLEYNETWETEEPDMYNVVRLKWVSEKGVPVDFGMGVPMEYPIESILGITFMMPMIDNGSGEPQSLVSVLHGMLKGVTLGADGSVTAKYVDAATGEEVDSHKGFARYVVADDHTLRLFVDPAAIIKSTVANAAKSRSVDMNALFQGLMDQVVPMLANGVPVNYGPCIADADGNIEENPDAVSFYLGTETLLPILKVVSPVFADQDMIDLIVGIASQDPNMGAMAGMLPGILQALPDVIGTTSRIELGINLNKVS